MVHRKTVTTSLTLLPKCAVPPAISSPASRRSNQKQRIFFFLPKAEKIQQLSLSDQKYNAHAFLKCNKKQFNAKVKHGDSTQSLYLTSLWIDCVMYSTQFFWCLEMEDIDTNYTLKHTGVECYQLFCTQNTNLKH